MQAQARNRPATHSVLASTLDRNRRSAAHALEQTESRLSLQIVLHKRRCHHRVPPEFADVDVLVLGKTENWDTVEPIVPKHVKVITLPGTQCSGAVSSWDEIVAEASGNSPGFECQPEQLVSLVFTSGTTGMPKGAMQTHESMLLPTARFDEAFHLRDNPCLLSYLPLSHIAERQLIEMQSLISASVDKTLQ